jgi:leucyl aminopeptidase
VEFTIKTGAPEKLKAGCLVVGVMDGKELTPAAASLDKAAGGAIARLLGQGELEAKAGATLMLHALPGLASPRVLVVSLGKSAEFTEKAYRDAVAAAAKVLAGGRAEDAGFCLADVDVPGRSTTWAVQTAVRSLADAGYRYQAPKGRPENGDKPSGAGKITLLTRHKLNPRLEAAVQRGQAVAEGMALAKDLGNLPANVCTPSYLADTARKLAKEFKLKVDVLEREDMTKLGMGSLLSNPPNSSSSTTRAASPRRPRWCWWAKASPSTPVAFPSSRPPRWTR